MENDLNTISEQELEKVKRINTIPDEKSTSTSGRKLGEVKDMYGYWTNKQIAENPVAYIKYLKKQLEGKYHSDEIKKIISEIKKVKKEYLTEELSNGRSR